MANAAYGLDMVKRDAVLRVAPQHADRRAQTGRPSARAVQPSVAKDLEKAR